MSIKEKIREDFCDLINAKGSQSSATKIIWASSEANEKSTQTQISHKQKSIPNTSILCCGSYLMHKLKTKLKTSKKFKWKI